MRDAEQTVVDCIRLLLERRGLADLVIERTAALHEDLDLDSLELAELSAMLEDELGEDPYTAGLVPRTVGEVVEFYSASAA